MPIAAELPKWIDWTRAIIDPAMPWKLNANEKQLAAPWLTDALIEIYDEFANDDSALEELNSVCEQALVSAGADVSVRFLVLHLYYWLTRWARAGIAGASEDDDDEDDREALERTTAALAHLVNLLPIEDCPRAWPRVRWEITNSYAAGLWKRAAGLYDFAEQESLVSTTDARLMRGHFRYILALDPESRDDPLSDVTWEPRVLGSTDAFHPPQLFVHPFADQLAQALLFGSAVLRKDAAPQEHLDGLRDARNDLEKAMAALGGRVGGVYEAMLARCCLEVGDFGNAARHFESLLKRTVDFGGDLGDSRRFRPHIYLQAARSFRAAAHPTDAANTLEAALREYPSDRPLLMEQADLAAQETDFIQAFRSLKAATEAHPELEHDLGIRLGVVLGEAFVSARDAAAAVESALEKHPEVAELIGGLVHEYWPTFDLLGKVARERWLTALCHMGLVPRLGSRVRSVLLEETVVLLAKVVESELRDRVFKRAKTDLANQGQVRARAGILNSSQPEHRFVLFVIAREAKLTLGEMHRVLAATQNSREGLSVEFRSWLAARIPRWGDLIALLDQIVRVRNPAAHPDDEVEVNVRQVHSHCRRVLDILVGQVR